MHLEKKFIITPTVIIYFIRNKINNMFLFFQDPYIRSKHYYICVFISELHILSDDIRAIEINVYVLLNVCMDIGLAIIWVKQNIWK